jgi:glutamyl-tRNA reductase
VETLRVAELERFGTRLSDMSDEQREVVESITRGIVAKLLHSPSVRLREAAGTPQGERLAAAIRDLFHLD